MGVIQQEVVKQVPVPQVQTHEKIVEVPQVQVIERIVEVPQIQYQEVVRQVPKVMLQEVLTELPVRQVQTCERIVEVPQVQTVQRQVVGALAPRAIEAVVPASSVATQTISSNSTSSRPLDASRVRSAARR